MYTTSCTVSYQGVLKVLQLFEIVRWPPLAAMRLLATGPDMETLQRRRVHGVRLVAKNNAQQ